MTTDLMYCWLCHVLPKKGSLLLLNREAVKWDEENLLNQLFNYVFLIFNREVLIHKNLYCSYKLFFDEYSFYLLSMSFNNFDNHYWYMKKYLPVYFSQNLKIYLWTSKQEYKEGVTKKRFLNLFTPSLYIFHIYICIYMGLCAHTWCPKKLFSPIYLK